MKQWWCVSCLAQIALDRHGRCSMCGSDSVDRIERGTFQLNHTLDPDKIALSECGRTPAKKARAYTALLKFGTFEAGTKRTIRP